MGCEPRHRALPPVVRRVRHVPLTLVAVEPMAGVWVPDDVGVDGRVGQRLAQLLDVVDGDRLVEVAEQTEPRRRERAISALLISEIRANGYAVNRGESTFVQETRSVEL